MLLHVALEDGWIITAGETFILKKIYPKPRVVPMMRTKGGVAHAIAARGAATVGSGAAVPADIEWANCISY